MIHWDGTIEYVGDNETSRAHVYGRNYESIGLCVPGDWRFRRPPEPALVSTVRLVAYLRGVVLGREVPVLGHGEAALPGHGTECPGDELLGWKREVFGVDWKAPLHNVS